MANVKPLRDRVLVRRIEEGEQKVGGIIIPDTRQGEAAAGRGGGGRLGPHAGERPDACRSTVKAGDKVLVGKWSGTEVKIDGERVPDPRRKTRVLGDV